MRTCTWLELGLGLVLVVEFQPLVFVSFNFEIFSGKFIFLVEPTAKVSRQLRPLNCTCTRNKSTNTTKHIVDEVQSNYKCSREVKGQMKRLCFLNQNGHSFVPTTYRSQSTANIGPILSTGRLTASRMITKLLSPGLGMPAAPMETNVQINLKVNGEWDVVVCSRDEILRYNKKERSETGKK